MAETTLERLCREYADWCEAEGLPPISAEDQDASVLTARQAAWLDDFIERWNAGGQTA